MIKKILIIIEIILYILILIQNFGFIKYINYYNKICFLSIFFCIFITNNFKNSIIFFITTIADYFLLFTNYYTIGIIFFIIVQILRLFHYSTKKEIPIILVLFSLLIGIIIKLLINTFIGICTIYAFLLISNAIIVIKQKKFYLSIGMILFILCDFSVALYYLYPNLTISSKLIWIFYLPSAILLSFYDKKECNQ